MTRVSPASATEWAPEMAGWCPGLKSGRPRTRLRQAPRPCAMLHTLAGKHTEAALRYRVTADIDMDTAAGRLVGSHTEFLDEAAEALSSARRLCDEGYLNVEITDTTTGQWCDEASLERAAGAEGR